jgi:hypothetical protein
MYTTIAPSIGADPEFFVFKQTSDGLELVSADKVFPSKEGKANISGGSVFFDGVQAEINPHHNTCRERFGSNIRYVLQSSYRIASDEMKGHNLVFIPKPVVDVDFNKLEGCDDECFRFGCAPSQSIYPMRKINYPDGKIFDKRFAGGHFHLGFSSLNVMRRMNNPEKLEEFIKLADIIAGITGVAIAHTPEERIRRQYYGQAGTYRIQPHGIEYRTLSNFWLTSPQLMSLMSALVREALAYSYGDVTKQWFDSVDMKEIVKVINTVDYKKAVDIYRTVIEPRFIRRSQRDYSPLTHSGIRDIVNRMIEVGYENVFNPEKMLWYWNIDDNHRNVINPGSMGYDGIESLAYRFDLHMTTYEQLYNMV